VSHEDVDKNDIKTVKTDSSHLKIFKIIIFIIMIVIIGWISWFSFSILFSGVLTEGNSNLNFDEVNETVAASHQISHLSDQEYQSFPKLKEAVANPKADSNWVNGHRYLGITKISEQQKDFIMQNYTNDGYYTGYLEYNGKYYVFEITLS
jgi:hypothetical protein